MISADYGVDRHVAFMFVVVVVYQFAGVSRGIDYACVTAPGEDDYSLACCVLAISTSRIRVVRKMENIPF